MRFPAMALALALTVSSSPAQEHPAYTFGTTVVDLSGLEGRVYHLNSKTQELPNFSKLKPVGTVYTTRLNVWPQRFDEGFPNITDRFEWFGIVYTGKIWIANDGEYRFSLLSDDGAKLRVNGQLVINNDGIHRAAAASASAILTRGTHEIAVEYFQGPRFTVALVLAVAPPGEPWRVFDTRDFKPPQDPSQWTKGKILEIRAQTIQ